MAASGYFPPRAPLHAAGRVGWSALCIAKQNSRQPPSSAALRPVCPSHAASVAGALGAGASSIASGRSIAIEAAMGAVSRDQQEHSMATIGTFTKTGDTFTGAVKTLSISAKTTIKPSEKASDKAPDYRIFAAQVEFGAAWKKTSGEGREYLSVKLDDPSFPAPIYATLIEGEEAGSYSLIWSRRNGD